jgi:acyl-CoA synthetase (AMP-forming)/AMP-acid ligase II
MNRPEFIEVYGACELAGYIAATINFRLAQEEVKFVISDSAPRVLFFEAKYAELLADLKSHLETVEVYVCIGNGPAWAVNYESFVESGDLQGPPCRSTPDDVAHLIYTSGTTGRPKGCMLAQRESVWKCAMHVGDMGITPSDRMLLMMPLFHVGAKSMQSAMQYGGGCVILHSAFDATSVIKSIQDDSVTHLHLAPTMLQTLLENIEAETFERSQLRLICYSAAPMPVPVLRRGLSVFGDVFHQIYGQTEGICTVLLRSQHRLENARDLQRLTSVGQPIPGVEVVVVDNDGTECPVGTAGEIIYRGGSTFRGYWNDSVKTYETLRDGWCYSGDIGRFDEDGFLYIVDRRKDMIISGGENIYSKEVEEALQSHPDVVEVAVFGIPDPKWGEAVCAVIVVTTGSSVSDVALIEHCQARIASYKKPKVIKFAAALPKTVNGKMDKQAIRSQILDGPALPL